MTVAVTNNPLAVERLGAMGMRARFVESGCMGVYLAARDMIHLGHRLVTHPLAGSVAPGRAPYRTILLESAGGPPDAAELSMIEEGIRACAEAGPGPAGGEWGEGALADFRLIDCDLALGPPPRG